VQLQQTTSQPELLSRVQEIEATSGSLSCLSQPSIYVQGESTHISMQILETGEEKLLSEHEGSSIAAPETSQELSLSMRPHTRLQSGIRKVIHRRDDHVWLFYLLRRTSEFRRSSR
jgi:hypothetical protein